MFVRAFAVVLDALQYQHRVDEVFGKQVVAALHQAGDILVKIAAQQLHDLLSVQRLLVGGHHLFQRFVVGKQVVDAEGDGVHIAALRVDAGLGGQHTHQAVHGGILHFGQRIRQQHTEHRHAGNQQVAARALHKGHTLVFKGDLVVQQHIAAGELHGDDIVGVRLGEGKLHTGVPRRVGNAHGADLRARDLLQLPRNDRLVQIDDGDGARGIQNVELTDIDQRIRRGFGKILRVQLGETARHAQHIVEEVLGFDKVIALQKGLIFL